MFGGVKIRVIAILLLIHLSSTTAKSNKKSKDDSVTIKKKTPLVKTKTPPAIIAIEIVDPHENKTGKNSKRTIEGSLGYGYQSPPKYQVYKYSQHDIPPFRPSSYFSAGIKNHQYNIQQQQYNSAPQLNQHYQPGTTLYSTVNNAGHVGGLTSYLPQHAQEPQVPVIILRVFPSQLADPTATLRANLPQTHPLASVVNSIDIQSLLAGHLQNQQQYYQPQYQQDYQYEQPELLTHENYPKDTHTRVIFRTDKNNEPSHTETKNIPVVPEQQSYSMVQVETPHMQYRYENPIEQNYYYQPQQQDQEQYYYNQEIQDAGYQQQQQQQVALQQQQQQSYVHQQTDAPYNYHAHHKRSKKTRLSRVRQQSNDEIVLDPIK